MTKLVRKLPWDSRHFGFPIARLQGRGLTAAGMKAAMRDCRRNKIRCLYWTVPVDDRSSIRLAENNGFEFVGIRLSYFLQSDEADKSARYSQHSGTDSDLAELKSMSRGLYRHSRFYFNERFPKDRADEMYAIWAGKLKTYILRKRGQIAGHVGWSTRGKNVRIQLFGVHPKFQGRGIGKVLLGNFLAALRRKGYSRFETGTQGSNLAAIRLYESAGFKIKKMEIDYHKWF